jgi:hypothetical protein
LLGEHDDVTTHVRKLRPVAETLHVSGIIAALDRGEFTAALEEIDAYLRKATALVVAGFADIPRLRLQLQTLELRLESLSDEKAELDRRLITFNRRHDDVLGDLIKRILKAQAELARLHAADQTNNNKKQKEAEAIAEETEQTYEDYASQHEELQRAEPLPKLDMETEMEMKSLYRKACGLCHPDKVPEERKGAAHRVFVELQDAYKCNDLTRVREIHKTLVTGELPGTRSTTLSEAEALKTAIAEMEYAIAKLVSELKSLQASTAVKLVDTAGVTEADWQIFLEKQREALEMELVDIVSAILAVQSEERDSHE